MKLAEPNIKERQRREWDSKAVAIRLTPAGIIITKTSVCSLCVCMWK